MQTSLHRNSGVIAAIICLLGLGAGSVGAADDARVTESIMVVNADHVYVRSGAGDSYYPFGKLDRGELVSVVGEKYSWARVQTVGTAFDGFFGYVRLPQNDLAAFQKIPNSKQVRTTGPVDLLAPNLNTEYSPDESWKRILQVPADVKLTVLETTESDRSVIYKVELPATATGFISRELLEPATPAQITEWRLALAPADARMAVAKADEAVREIETPEAEPVEFVAERIIVPAITTNDMSEPFRGPEAVVVAEPEVAESIIEWDPIVETETLIGTARNAAESDPITNAAPALPKMEASIDIETARENRDRTPRGLLHRMEQLEKGYRQLRNESIQYAEVLPLRALYLELARDAVDEPGIHRPAKARSEQLAIWADLQNRRNEIAALKQRVNLSAEAAASAWDVAELRGGYEAVGRLERSIVFHGGGDLPVLYRVQNPRTGSTVVYIRPTADLDLPGMVGQRVGVIGNPLRNPSLGVIIVTPRRIDLLASTG